MGTEWFSKRWTNGARSGRSLCQDVSALLFWRWIAEFVQSCIVPLKDLRPTIHMEDFPRISVMQPEATSHKETVRGCQFRQNLMLQAINIRHLPDLSVFTHSRRRQLNRKGLFHIFSRLQQLRYQMNKLAEGSSSEYLSFRVCLQCSHVV